MVQIPLIGAGYIDRLLTQNEIQEIVAKAVGSNDYTGQRILVLIPDSTRTMPMGLFFHVLCDELLEKTARLDFLVALGTHPLLSEEMLTRHMGITNEERLGKYARVGIYNHRWDLPDTFTTLGTITREETSRLSRGMLSLDVPVRINRMVLEYDALIVLGPVFPHEVAGFSGGNKYFFPGISGPEVINFTHWLGALITSFETIGKPDTPVRAVINCAADFIPRPKLFLCAVANAEGVEALYASTDDRAWQAAVGISARTHIRYVDKPYNKVLSVLPTMYDDLWTGAKGMYKMEPVIADGGEVILYAPGITEISYTHGKLIDQVGYHVRDYFVKQWQRFKDYPWGVLAHSTHLKGLGLYDGTTGIEQPRIRVSLATGITAEQCGHINLGHVDPASIHLTDWQGREEEGILVVPRAGEMLYRLK